MPVTVADRRFTEKISNAKLKQRVSALAAGFVNVAGLQPKESNVLMLLNDGIGASVNPLYVIAFSDTLFLRFPHRRPGSCLPSHSLSYHFLAQPHLRRPRRSSSKCHYCARPLLESDPRANCGEQGVRPSYFDFGRRRRPAECGGETWREYCLVGGLGEEGREAECAGSGDR